MAGSSDDNRQECLLLYDGRCRLCVMAKKGLERLGADAASNKVRMVMYQSEEAKRVLGAQYRPGHPDVALLVSPNVEIASGLDAFLPLLPGLKCGRFLSALFKLPLVRPLGSMLYWVVARFRYALFGEIPLESCPEVRDPNPSQLPPQESP